MNYCSYRLAIRCLDPTDGYNVSQRLLSQHIITPHSLTLKLQMRTLIVATLLSSAAGVVIDCVPGCDAATQSCELGVCECLPGYKNQIFAGLPCVDIDECNENPGICGSNSICTNKNPSYSCECDTGFEDVSGNCVDIDECATGAHTCPPATDCQNTSPLYDCVSQPLNCPPGFFDAGGSCQDINECLSSTHPHNCLTGSTCENNDGGFTCNSSPCPPPQIRHIVLGCLPPPSCPMGHSWTGTMCADIDECASGTVCSVGEVCQNNIGSYSCIPAPPAPQCVDVETKIPSVVAWPSSAVHKQASQHFHFNSFPQYLDGTKMYIPDITQGSDLHLTCCKDECQFFVAMYRCLPCSSMHSGGFDTGLSSAAWESTSCAPAFNVVGRSDGPKPMVVFHKVLQKGEAHTLSLAPATSGIPFIAVFQKDVPDAVSCPLNRGPFAAQNPRDCSVC